jgi:SAM-dependent methyltransferase
MQSGYLKTIYSEQRTPKTEYPNKLVIYLMTRFRLQPNGKILEIGSGRGDFINEFYSLKMECFAIDRENDEHLKREIIFEKTDLENEPIPYSDDFFDVVYHKSVLEHFYSPHKIMQESIRVLKPGGKLVFLVPDWETQWKTFYEDITHCRPYTLQAVRDLLVIYGLEEIVAEKFYQLPIVWRFPFLKALNRILQLFISNTIGRTLSKLIGIKYFRWSVELMILGYGRKSSHRN